MAKARASGDVIMVNGKQPMTERRYQAELMKDVHKFHRKQQRRDISSITMGCRFRHRPKKTCKLCSGKDI